MPRSTTATAVSRAAPRFVARAVNGRRWPARWSGRILDLAPDVVLVLLKASPATIRQRMRENPHPYQVVREQDVEYVLRRFEEEVAAALVQKRIVLDTTAATVAETLDQFVAAYEPFLTNEDLLRMRQRQAQ